MFSGLSRTQSFAAGFIALVLVTLGIGWLGKSMIENETPGELEFWHAGYYRDDAMNRLFTITFLPSAAKPDVRRYAEQLTYTPGHITVALFYPEGSRIPILAAADTQASLSEAKQQLREVQGASAWRYAARKDEAGELRLVDCEQQPDDPLCGR